MTEEQKDLLLKDLCCRLPYRTLISIGGDGNKYRMEEIRNALIGIDTFKITIDGYDIEHIKPYLLPMSSMTDEQSKELDKIDPEFYSLICENGDRYVNMTVSGFDWLNKNHFDYRGLIEKSLALDATNLGIYE